MRCAGTVVGIAVGVCVLLAVGCGGGRGAARSLAGRYIVFWSDRPGGAGSRDVYLYDGGSRSLASLPGLNSDRKESSPCISEDGRYIAFGSNRFDGGGYDVYLYDRQSASLVSLPGLNSADMDWYPGIN